MKDVFGLARSIKPTARMKFDLGGTMPVPAEHPLESTMRMENQPRVVTSPVPGVRGRIADEAKYLDPNISHKDDLTKWTPSTPNLIGAPVPPPVQVPVHSAPRHEELVKHVSKIFNDKGFQDYIYQNTGLRGVKVTPVRGMYESNEEPTFIIHHPNMTDEHTNFIAPAVGFGFQQDSAVRLKHNPDITEGIPSMLIGTGNKLNKKQIDGIMNAAREEGLTGAQETLDNRAVKFLHFDGEKTLPDFFDKIDRVMQRTNMPHKLLFHSDSELINNEDYLKRLHGTSGARERDPNRPGEPSDLFRGVVSNVLAPYTKAISGEGYRLSPERLKETYGLTPEETTHVRESLYPSGRKVHDRTTIPLMEGTEQLDVRPTGHSGKPTVDDVLFALDNRAAKKGQIELGDYSDKARDLIANDIAKEVAYHTNNTDKSAIGWYDAALRRALGHYETIFPELKTDKDKQMLFHALLGITSQGNNVYENSVYAARLYDQIRNGATIPEALDKLRGGFGNQTKAIEQNIEKFHHLIETNGYDRMRDVFNKKMTVSDWKKALRTDKTLFGPDGKSLADMIKGAKGQKVTGWSVFGPKIGSFINNLHGDYSTLTADLWFSRTWNRLLGHNFVHAPITENKQYQDFRDALKAEYEHNNGFPSTQTPYKTSEGQYTNKKWEHGIDTKDMSPEDFKKLYNDPDAIMQYAYDLESDYRKGGYKQKSDLRRRAKNWIENRENAVAAPRSGLERDFQQRTAEKAQEILRKKHNLNIDIADIQAALWFHEKELFNKLGVASEKAKPADYEDAAKHTLDMINKGDLYKVKSKSLKKLAPPPIEEEPEHEARGGYIKAYGDGGEVDRTKMSHKDVTKRILELQKAAQKLGTDEMTAEMYDDLVNKHKPILPWDHVPNPASLDEIYNALREDQRKNIGMGQFIPAGHPVGLRLDIPAYSNHQTWVPTIHDNSTSKATVLAHEPAAHITNAKFWFPEKKALNVARGVAKSPFATIDGEWNPTHPDDIHAMATAALNDPEWAQVGMDPERHSYFYDRKTTQPILSAARVLQVGPLVLAHKPVYGDKKDFAFSEGGEVDRDGFGFGGDTEFAGSKPERGATGSVAAAAHEAPAQQEHSYRDMPEHLQQAQHDLSAKNEAVITAMKEANARDKQASAEQFTSWANAGFPAGGFGSMATTEDTRPTAYAMSDISKKSPVMQDPAAIVASLVEPAGTPTSGYNPKAQAAGTFTAGYNPQAIAAGTPTSGYNPQAIAAGTPTSGYDRLAMAAGTPTGGYNPIARAAGTPTGGYNPSPIMANVPTPPTYPAADSATFKLASTAAPTTDRGGGRRLVKKLMPDGTYQDVWEDAAARGGSIAKYRPTHHSSAIIEHALGKVAAPPPAFSQTLMVAKRGRPL